MYAWAIRKDRHGEPISAMQQEVVPIAEVGDDECLVMVMAAGVNYNGVWAALGIPLSPFDVHKQPYHIAGSDASGIVYAVGSKVKRWKVGDEVVIHCNQDDGDDEECNGGDPMNSPSQRIWGYETTDGSFAQFCKVQSRQLMPRPRHLTWEEAGCYTLVLATAYRMLFGHPPHTLKPGDNVLVWGGAGGLGSMAIQLIAASGANAIAVISEEDKRDFVMSLGAKGAINRKHFDCWGEMPDPDGQRRLQQVAGRGAQVRQGDLGRHRQGQRRRHRVRAPGRRRPSRSRALVCKRGGMVVICAGTTGYKLTVDARYLWMRQKRLQGSHFANLQAGLGRQPVRAQPPGRPLHERGVRLGRHPARAHEDVEEPAQAREHGGAGPGQAPRHAHARGGDGGVANGPTGQRNAPTPFATSIR